MIFPYTCEAEAASTIRLQAGKIHLPETKCCEKNMLIMTVTQNIRNIIGEIEYEKHIR